MKRSTTSDFRKPWRGVRRRSFRAGSEEGQSLVEFALVLPLLGMLLIGIVYGGITFYDYETLAYAVAVGARTLSTGAGTSGPCTGASTAVTNAATNLKASSINVSISFPASNLNTDVCDTTTTTLYANDVAAVNATYPCNLTIPFTGINLCPVNGPVTTTNSSGLTTMYCPYTHCISSTITVPIE